MKIGENASNERHIIRSDDNSKKTVKEIVGIAQKREQILWLKIREKNE